MIFLFAAALGLLLYFLGHPPQSGWSYALFFITSWPLFTVPYAIFSTINNLTSVKGSPFSRSQEFFLQNGRISALIGGLFILPLLQGAILISSDKNPQLFYLAFPILGLSIELFWLLMKEASQMSSPGHIVAILAKKGRKAIQHDDLAGLITTLSDLMEIATAAQKREIDTLFMTALSEIRELAVFFFQSSKSFAHLDEGLKNLETKKEDRLSYLLFFLLNHLEGFCDKARELQLKNRLTSLFATLARIAISAGSVDLSLALFPIDLLGKEALLAEEEGMKEAAIKGELTLLALAKEIASLPDLRYQELKRPFLPLIGYMRAISEALFKKDKSTSIKALLEPFSELKELFEKSAIKEHTDAPLLLLEVEKILASFQALQGIMIGVGPMAQPSEPPKPTS